MSVIYLKKPQQNNRRGIQIDLDRKSVTMNIKLLIYFALKDHTHYGQCKLIQPDTLKIYSTQLMFGHFTAIFTIAENENCRIRVLPSALRCASGQNLTSPTLLLSPDIPVLLKIEKLTY